MSTATLADNMTALVTRANDLVPKLWKNGTGVTREVACHPPGAALDSFEWRVSIADVAEAGPFSQFDGIDRTLVLLAGEGMRLTEENGRVHDLRGLLDVARFRGEERINAELTNGATRDFNLMVARDSVRAELTVWVGGTFDPKSASTLLFFCAQGHTQIVTDAGTFMLEAYDTLQVDNPNGELLTIRNFPGSVLAVRLYHSAAI